MRALTLPAGAAVSRLFAPLKWHPIGGTADAAVFPITGKPTITNSSCYVLRTPTTVVVIDPGADREQAALVAETVLQARRERERTFLLILTHAHLDHFLNIDQIVAACGRPLSFAHAEAVAAIARQDRSHTLAILYKDARLPDWQPDVALFAGGPAPSAGMGRWRPVPRGDPGLPHLALALDPGNTLEIYSTPGHSPCSCSVRLGAFIAIGDLPFAAKPGLAGLAGWSATALEQSLRTVSPLLRRGDIAVCGAGHGDCLPAHEMAATLEGVLGRLGGLGSLAALDERRVTSLRAFAVELLGEGQRLFAILGGRLLYVSHVLDYLEETGEAARIRVVLDIDAIERVLLELGRFHQAFEAGEHPELAVVLKANAAVERLQRVMAGAPALRPLCISLLGRVEQLLSAFGQTVQGLTFGARLERVDAVELMRSIAAEERDAMDGHATLLAGADGADVFAAAMARAIASRSLLATTPIVVEPTDADPIAVTVDLPTLRGLIVSLLELAAVGSGGRAVVVGLGRELDEVAIRIRSARGVAAIMPAQFLLYGRLLAGMGGRFEVRPTEDYVLLLPAS